MPPGRCLPAAGPPRPAFCRLRPASAPPPILQAPPPPPRSGRPEGQSGGLPSLATGSARKAAAATAARGAPGMDTRLDQETARWLRWDKVRGDRGRERPGEPWDPPHPAGAPLPFPRRARAPALPCILPLAPAGRTAPRKTRAAIPNLPTCRSRAAGWGNASRPGRPQLAPSAAGLPLRGSGAHPGRWMLGAVSVHPPRGSRVTAE